MTTTKTEKTMEIRVVKPKKGGWWLQQQVKETDLSTGKSVYKWVDMPIVNLDEDKDDN